MAYRVEIEMAGVMYNMGGEFADVESAFLFINRYDPDGTVRAAIVDTVEHREVDFAAYLSSFDQVERPLSPPPPRKKKPVYVPEKANWLDEGF